ncbi:MAG TPA: site-specific DNA-methyltransferase, partial [Candidatus Dormibacteraeota bacterium]|nr:site-specific DNA-methyltransferase [Candidatus Dormibacteraeota bacterium]
MLRGLPDNSTQMIYIDPPFNTGKTQRRISLKTVRSAEGHRSGFKGQAYSSERVSALQYLDIHDDYLGWLEERLVEGHRVLDQRGT